MVAEVGFMARVLEGYREGGDQARPDLVTRDFLGGCAVDDARDADVELANHDLVPGKKKCLRKSGCPLQDLNMYPAAASRQSPKACTRAPPYTYQSVCTIEKVKLALERLERESQSKHSGAGRPPDGSPTSSSVTSSSVKRRGGADDSVEQGDGCDSPDGLMAAACSKCFIYVLISKADPRCPRCDSHVPAPPVLTKKPRIDLNLDLLDA